MPAPLQRIVLSSLLTSWLIASQLGASAVLPLDEAQALFEDRRYAEAQAAFEILHENYPDHAGVLLYLGKLATKRQERVLAIEYLERARELRPTDPALQFEYAAACGLYAGTLGTSLKALTYARRASKGMERAIELDPENLTFRQGLIEFSLQAPATAGGGSRRAHEQAIAIGERDPIRGAFAQATIYRAENNHLAAMAALEQLITLAPDNYFARFNFGRCAAESGQRLETGRGHLEACLQLPVPDQAPPLAHVWWNLATIEKQLGNREAALAALHEAITLAPNDRAIAEDLALYAAETT